MVIIDAIIGLLPLIVILFMDAKKEKSSFIIASGISVLAVSAVVHVSKYSIHAYFNYLDIAHVFIMLNFWVMYLGIKKLPTSSA